MRWQSRPDGSSSAGRSTDDLSPARASAESHRSSSSPSPFVIEPLVRIDDNRVDEKAVSAPLTCPAPLPAGAFDQRQSAAAPWNAVSAALSILYQPVMDVAKADTKLLRVVGDPGAQLLWIGIIANSFRPGSVCPHPLGAIPPSVEPVRELATGFEPCFLPNRRGIG